MSSNLTPSLKETELKANTNTIEKSTAITTDIQIPQSNNKTEAISINASLSIDKIPENSVKHNDTSFSFKVPKEHSLISDFKLSSSSNTRSNPGSSAHHHNELPQFEEQPIKKPEPIQIGNINMNVNNYYAYYVDPTPETIKERILQAKEKKKYNCSCKKSQCLKLYCDCFANEEFCVDCNCQGCSNIIGNEAKITKAFNEVKDKNPIAMKFNINEDSLALGCNCTKSNCLKKYCECFKAKLSCTELCRCRDCDNCSQNINENKQATCNRLKQILKNSYEKFSFQKISVLIEKEKIHIHKQENIDSDQFLGVRPPKEQVLVRIKNHQTLIEIPKSLVDISSEEEKVLLTMKKMNGNK